MTIKSGPSAKSLRYQARQLQEVSGIPYRKALEQVTSNAGFHNWKTFSKSVEPIVKKEAPLRPPVPEPAVLKCYAVYSSAILGERPNARMPVKNHIALGLLLQEVLNYTRYHKRAYKKVNEILLEMDKWMGYEYNEEELPSASFNRIYLGHRQFVNEIIKSKRHQLRLKRKLRKAKMIIYQSYHDCRPVQKLDERFESAFRAMDKWPVKIKIPQYKPRVTQLKAGTFVRKKGGKKLIMVFYHDLRWKVIEGYGDAGPISLGRHEVVVVNESVDLAQFKPLRLFLPYGKWICADGSEVLFNRDYCAIWKRDSTGAVSLIDPEVKINQIDTIGYFNDRTAPYYYGNSKKLKECLAILQHWGVDGQDPLILQRLPAAIADSDVGILAPKGFS